MSKNFKKIDLINIISRETGFSKNFSKKILNDLLDILRSNISNGDLNLKNFGTFRLLNKKERIGRNPKTKQKFLISARKSVSFYPSQKILKYLNDVYE